MCYKRNIVCVRRQPALLQIKSSLLTFTDWHRSSIGNLASYITALFKSVFRQKRSVLCSSRSSYIWRIKIKSFPAAYLIHVHCARSNFEMDLIKFQYNKRYAHRYDVKHWNTSNIRTGYNFKITDQSTAIRINWKSIEN